MRLSLASEYVKIHHVFSFQMPTTFTMFINHKLYDKNTAAAFRQSSKIINKNTLLLPVCDAMETMPEEQKVLIILRGLNPRRMYV